MGRRGNGGIRGGDEGRGRKKDGRGIWVRKTRAG